LHRGFFPKGNGIVDIEIIPKFCYTDFQTPISFIMNLRHATVPLHLTEPPTGIRIEGISCASETLMKSDVAKRQIQGASTRIGGRYPVRIREEYQDTLSSGTVITLWAKSETGSVSVGGDALGERGVRAEKVGENAAASLLDVLESGAAIDSHLADNLIPLLALIGGVIRPKAITDHVLSNIYVCEKFLDVHFEIDHKRNIIGVVR
jgi:RNA 3'-terminal phosphate cyclase